MTTTDPGLRSFVDVKEQSHFPIQNLPLGIFRPLGGGRDAGAARAGVAIGEMVLDLALLEERGLLGKLLLDRQPVFNRAALNGFFALGPEAWSEVRGRVSRLLRHDEPTLRDDPALRGQALVPMNQVEMLLPVEIGDYTDFYSSREHATNVGAMFRGAKTR